VYDDAAAAHRHVDAAPLPIVVKADGLAAGKGVVVAATRDEAHAAVEAMLGRAAPRGSRVVIEEFLDGEEASFMVVCDGRSVLALATSQDHKRLRDDDRGPNTGGMGAYSPAPVVTPTVHARAMKEIIEPTLAGMAAEGRPFSGFLYAGLMIDSNGTPRTVEFNCRLGDPEAQPILMRLQSDLFELLFQAAEADDRSRLDQVDLQWDRRVALGVVMAAAGYPAAPRGGDVIAGLPRSGGDVDADGETVKVFHAGTSMRGDDVVSAGGRILCVTALGDSTRQAQERAYEVVGTISFAGAQWRTDIGQRAIRR